MTIAKRLAEETQIVSAFVPVDMSGQANDGDWVSLKGYDKCAIVLFKGVGTAGQDPTLSLQQATDIAGTGAKSLNFTTIHVKQDTVLTATGTFTKVTQAAAATYTDTTSAEDQAIWIVEIDADTLDVSGGFDCLRASVADVGAAAQLGCALYILYGARYPQQTPESAIVN